MRKIAGILVSVVLLWSMGLSVVNAAETTVMEDRQNLADTPSKYGFKGLYTLFSPDTYDQGRFGIGLYWDMTRFSLPGDPRYPEVQELTLAGAYGLTDRIEVGVAVPFRMTKLPAASTEGRLLTDTGTDEVSESGLSNVSVGVRFKLVETDAGFALTPFVQAFLPTASDPDKGLGADNTRILFGVSAGGVLENLGKTRLYTQAAYQFATDYDQDRRDFTETTPTIPDSQPRFERFGTNPLFHEYGNTLFYGAGFAIPLAKDKKGLVADLFTELQFFHSFEDANYIPMYEDGKELDDVLDGGIGLVGMKIGFGNGFTLTGGWGGKIMGNEPTYEAPMWRAFAGLTYNQLEQVPIIVEPPPKPITGEVGRPNERIIPPPPDLRAYFDCANQALMNVLFEFDRSTLTPEGIATLQQIAKIMRICSNLVLEVQGHTDWVGTENYNMGLGNRRARAVVYYLVYDEGIDPARVVRADKLARGVIAGETYGESQPIASNETDAGRAQNRRAQFVKLVDDTRKIEIR